MIEFNVLNQVHMNLSEYHKKYSALPDVEIEKRGTA